MPVEPGSDRNRRHVDQPHIVECVAREDRSARGRPASALSRGSGRAVTICDGSRLERPAARIVNLRAACAPAIVHWSLEKAWLRTMTIAAEVSSCAAAPMASMQRRPTRADHARAPRDTRRARRACGHDRGRQITMLDGRPSRADEHEGEPGHREDPRRRQMRLAAGQRIASTSDHEHIGREPHVGIGRPENDPRQQDEDERSGTAPRTSRLRDRVSRRLTIANSRQQCNDRQRRQVEHRPAVAKRHAHPVPLQLPQLNQLAGHPGRRRSATGA